MKTILVGAAAFGCVTGPSGAGENGNPSLRRARVTGHASERSLELGHHDALGSVEVDVLLSLRHPRHLQPVRGRLDARPTREPALVEHLIGETCAKHGIQPGQLTLHADRGSSMKSKPVALLLADLGVTKTHSRPHVSNDNPFSEAQFKTLKYCPQFPERFGSLEDGRAFGQVFFPWYNQEHRHSGLGFLTPAVVHFGQAPTVRAQRQQVLAAAYAAHPERFVKGRSQPADLPRAVWINPPAKNTAAQDAPGTTIVIMDDLRVDQSRDADDHVAVMIVDRNATLITAPLVSQCH